MTKYNSDLHHVKIHTWGTHDKPTNGMDNFAKQHFFGGNVGHASIVMTLPVNDETKALVEKYCYEQTFAEYKAGLKFWPRYFLTYEHYVSQVAKRIPFTLKTQQTPLLKHNEEGQLEKTDELASETQIYEIEFSWWPSTDSPVFLSTLEEDRRDEREAKHFEYSDQAKAYLQPEERIHNGLLGGQMMTYAPRSVLHQRDLNDAQLDKAALILELESLNEQLKAEDLLLSKIQGLDKPQIQGSLKLICKNIGFPVEQNIKEFLENNPNEKDIELFKQFFLEKATSHLNGLKEKKAQLEEAIKAHEATHNTLEKSAYITQGVSPDHTVILPFLSDDSQGLSPEAMLKKIRALTDPDAEDFNLHTNNCSNTTTKVLAAGAEHDPLLNSILSEEALGFFGTPQQVLGNVQRAQEVIHNNGNHRLHAHLKNSEANKALGKIISPKVSTIMDEDLQTSTRIKAILSILPSALPKLPDALRNIIVNPSETMQSIVSGMSLVNKNAKLALVKGLLIGGGVMLLLLLSPFALVEQSVKLLIKPFQAIRALFSKKEEPVASLENQITTPLPTAMESSSDADSSYHSMRAGLINDRVAKSVKNHSAELTHKKNPLEMLDNFEAELKKDSDKIIMLSSRDFDTLNRFVMKKNNPALSERFKQCCEESLHRANKLAPKTPNEVDNAFVTMEHTRTKTYLNERFHAILNQTQDKRTKLDKLISTATETVANVNDLIIKRQDKVTSKESIKELNAFLEAIEKNNSQTVGRLYFMDFIKQHEKAFNLMMDTLGEEQKEQFLKDMEPLEKPSISATAKSNVLNVMSWVSSPLTFLTRKAVPQAVQETMNAFLPSTSDSHCKNQLKQLAQIAQKAMQERKVLISADISALEDKLAGGNEALKTLIHSSDSAFLQEILTENRVVLDIMENYRTLLEPIKTLDTKIKRFIEINDHWYLKVADFFSRLGSWFSNESLSDKLAKAADFKTELEQMKVDYEKTLEKCFESDSTTRSPSLFNETAKYLHSIEGGVIDLCDADKTVDPDDLLFKI